MKPELKVQAKKIIRNFILLFCLLFLLRLAYGFYTTPNSASVIPGMFDSISENFNNIASYRYKNGKKGTSAKTISGAQSVDQKYEKIAQVKNSTSNFKNKEALARNEIENLNALIQFEQKSGNDGNRKLNLVIGVPPNNFDSLYSKLCSVGISHFKQITKKDKTNEYRELNAKKASLEKTLNSLISIKEKSGKIEEYMNLENRILEIEKNLQDLGVSLGDFDTENEFCTIKFSLNESFTKTISIAQRLKVAFEWTVKFAFTMLFGFFLLVGIAYIFVLGFDKVKSGLKNKD